MKKWKKRGLSIGMAATLTVPAVASASIQQPVDALKQKAEQDLWSNVTKTEKESAINAYKQRQEANEVVSSDTVIIKYDQKLSPAIHKKAGTVLEKSYPALGYDVVRLTKGQKLSDVLAYYAKQEGVKGVSQSIVYKRLAAPVQDPRINDMYHMSLLNINEAAKLAGKNKVTVAVIDTGVDVKHPDLKNKILPPVNIINPAQMSVTLDHGTHVSGIIAAEKGNGIGGYGINPNATILPIDVFNGDYGTTDYIIAEGILYAIENGADVINMSLGGSMPSPILEEAVQKAVDAGITVVAAAGNDYGESYNYPASYKGVIAVGATNDKNELAEFSTFGASVDVVAPGEEVYSTIYDYMKGSSYAKLSGTSMASPVVAGVVSLLKTKYPDLTPYQVEYILEQTAKDFGKRGYDTIYGYGLVDPVKVMNFDVKSIPAFPETDEKKAIEEAETVDEAQEVISGSFKSPNQVHYAKVSLEQGAGVQLELSGAEDYNYEMELKFIPEGSEEATETINVDNALNGEVEGSFYVAEEKGTLLIAVKDVYGNYNVDGSSTYDLKVTKVEELVIDSSSKETPTEITIPYNSSEDPNGPFTLTVPADATEADKDYFKFTVSEPTTVKFELSGIAGLNTSLGVFFEEDLNMEIPEGIPEWEWQYFMPYFQYSNRNGVGEGETISFEAIPGQNYVLEVATAQGYDYWYGPIYNIDLEEGKVANSSIAYELTGSTFEPEPDEDGYPMWHMPEEKVMEEEITMEEYRQEKKDRFKEAKDAMEEDYWRYYPEEMVSELVSVAIPFEIGSDVEGGFQFAGDEDVYTFTPSEDAIYHFEMEESDEYFPWVQFYQYDEEHHDLFPVGEIWAWYGSSQGWETSIALEEGTQYIAVIRNDFYEATEDPYVLISKKLSSIPEDNDVDDSKAIRAKVVGVGDKVKNHLIFNSDIDYYYYKHEGEQTYLGLSVNTLGFTDEEKQKLPKELQNPLMPYLTIVEDTNGNLQMSEDEAAKAISFYPSYYSSVQDVYGSFKAKKDVGYFLVVSGATYYGGVSVEPYEIGLHTLNMKDEDAASSYNGKVPTKPLALTKGSAKGYLNAGVDFGDKDAYKLVVDKTKQVTITLDTPAELDGVITVLDANGNQVANVDYYSAEDEVAVLTLNKGTYYIIVEDAFMRSSKNPYTLKVQ
ncbi:S8 family peptidase [Bacillus litorisediminis]|uniref:S8 family peptidase n=1 Tax=Bacillus litorisediminis TaxID=2922713 RepID=UPI001FAFD141|nr:S8 family serine peptidase [Bacillus litorisediminis]